MRLAMRVPGKQAGKKGASSAAESGTNTDPREQESAEIIDLASRTAYPAVTQRKTASDGMGLAAGVAIVGLLGAVSFWAMNSARLAEPDQSTAQAAGTAQATPAAAQPKAAQVAKAEPVVKPKTPAAAPAPVVANAPNRNIGAAPAANPYASPTVAFDAGARGAPLGTVAAPAVASAAPNANNSGGASGSAAAFANSIGGVGGATAAAQPLANPSTTVTKGTMIPAILETAINTDVPGFVRAVVSQDVRSFDGTNVLLPRSTRLVGQYQSGVQQGQKRAYVIWTDAIRPDGVTVSLGSPGVGFDGTTGLSGEVDTHFFSRFGSAMLLSVVGGLGAIASGGASVVIGGAGQSAASTALQQDGQRSPTIRVRQGEPIRIFTARNLDFTGV